jgi:hypothetical protein
VVSQQPDEDREVPRWFPSLISSGRGGSIPSQMRRKEKSVGVFQSLWILGFQIDSGELSMSVCCVTSNDGDSSSEVAANR